MKRLTLTPFLALVALAVVGLITAGCTLKNQEAPPLAGPSEFGTSVVATASPDELTQDGSSQALVTITARGPNGEPLRNLSLRTEIQYLGVATDFGAISARNLVTGADGRATLVYTAPSSPAGPAVDNFVKTEVTIAVWPIGTNFDNTTPRFVTIRLVPPGVVAPPDRLRPAFTFTPSSPADHEAVFFDASTSGALPSNPITDYRWSFGDSQTGTGKTLTHAFSQPGSYVVSLTIFDAFNRSATTTQVVTVAAGIGPTASFLISPAAPQAGQVVNFNASNSRPAPGRTIVSYDWNFGDGETKRRTDPATTHDYVIIGNYTVSLTVTDDAGRTAFTSQTITIGNDAPTADFTLSPTSPTRNSPVSFNGGGSTAAPGRTIVSYTWDFGGPSASPATQGPSQSPTAQTTYSAAGTFTVVLTVTDSAGKTGRKTLTVSVQ